MRYPRILIWAEDDTLELGLRPLVQKHRWVVERLPHKGSVPTPPASPTVVLLQIDPQLANPEPLLSVLEWLRLDAEWVVVVFCQEKIPEPERPNWVANMMALGASFVVFPPWTESLLEDLLTGFLRARPIAPAAKGSVEGEAIDLAQEGQAEES